MVTGFEEDQLATQRNLYHAITQLTAAIKQLNEKVDTIISYQEVKYRDWKP